VNFQGFQSAKLFMPTNLPTRNPDEPYFLGEMVTDFLQGKTGPVTILEFPIKAIDANIVNEHWLMIVLSRGVVKLDLRRLNWSKQGENGHKHCVRELTPLSPVWQGRDVEQLVGA